MFSRIIELIAPRVEHAADSFGDSIDLEYFFDDAPSKAKMLVFDQVMGGVLFAVGYLDETDTWIPTPVIGEIPRFTVFSVLDKRNAKRVYEGEFTLSDDVIFDEQASAEGICKIEDCTLLIMPNERFESFMGNPSNFENAYKVANSDFSFSIRYLPFDDDEPSSIPIWAEVVDQAINEVSLVEIDTEQSEQTIAVDARTYRTNFIKDLDTFDTLKDNGKLFNILSVQPENPNDPYHFQIVECEGKILGAARGVISNWQSSGS